MFFRYTAEDVLDRNQTASERNQPVFNGKFFALKSEFRLAPKAAQ